MSKLPETHVSVAPEARFRRLEFYVVLAVVGFVVAFALISIWAGFDQVMARVELLTIPVLLLMLGLSIANYALRGARWHWFTDGLGLKVPLRRNFAYFIAGLAMTTTPAKAGEALRVWLIERCHGYGYQRTAPLFIADRLSDIVAVFLLCLAGVGAFSNYADVTIIAALAVLALLVPLMRPRVLMVLTNQLYGLFGQRWPRLFARLRAALRDTARLFTLKRFGIGLILALVGWFCEAYAFHLLLDVLGASVTLQEATFIFTFAMIAGTAALLPGGLGGTEAVMIALLRLRGVDLNTAVAATAVIRLTTLWFASGLGFAVLPVVMRQARRGPIERGFGLAR